MADSQITILIQSARLVATRWMNPNLANNPNLSTMTVELTKRKCIWRKVNKAWRKIFYDMIRKLFEFLPEEWDER